MQEEAAGISENNINDSIVFFLHDTYGSTYINVK